jgi:hypothetical protein
MEMGTTENFVNLFETKVTREAQIQAEDWSPFLEVARDPAPYTLREARLQRASEGLELILPDHFLLPSRTLVSEAGH